jgi:hypothetical protein
VPLKLTPLQVFPIVFKGEHHIIITFEDFEHFVQKTSFEVRDQIIAMGAKSKLIPNWGLISLFRAEFSGSLFASNAL